MHFKWIDSYGGRRVHSHGIIYAALGAIKQTEAGVVCKLRIYYLRGQRLVQFLIFILNSILLLPHSLMQCGVLLVCQLRVAAVGLRHELPKEVSINFNDRCTVASGHRRHTHHRRRAHSHTYSYIIYTCSSRMHEWQADWCQAIFHRRAAILYFIIGSFAECFGPIESEANTKRTCKPSLRRTISNVYPNELLCLVTRQNYAISEITGCGNVSRSY